MGATDVCPIIPVKNTTIKECVKYSKMLAEKVSKELNIPTYLYEYSATNKERQNLANIRKGEAERVSLSIKKANEILRWEPKTLLDQGILEVVRSIKK